MICIENPNGYIEISHEYFANLIGYAASACYGVAEMAASNKVQGFTERFFHSKLDRGVKVNRVGSKLFIDLHIVVTYGVNITVIVKSIIKKVRYVVEEATGLKVDCVNVFVDGMKPE
jgi:uncharacterized alkaline shock family protein YloU